MIEQNGQNAVKIKLNAVFEINYCFQSQVRKAARSMHLRMGWKILEKIILGGDE